MKIQNAKINQKKVRGKKIKWAIPQIPETLWKESWWKSDYPNYSQVEKVCACVYIPL